MELTIIYDSGIPYLAETILQNWRRVRIIPLKSEEIDASAVREADVLIIRTRTRIDASLLAGSRVQLVCTATIGFDHIDIAYCESHGIQWMSCPGCNAQAVCDYIEEALDEYSPFAHSLADYSPLTLGIVGVGHVGSRVAQMAQRKGYQILLNDPPKEIGVSLDEIAQKCDIITFHVPLDTTTYHLCNTHFLDRCKPDALIINASRGGVVDEKALLCSGHPFILDTWENEPDIYPDVLRKAFRASMHIAGYSVEGKRNASQMCLDAIARHFQLPPVSLLSENKMERGDSAPGWLERLTLKLKADINSVESPAAHFEQLRKAYLLR